MSFAKILRLGLIHVAVAITLVPINGTLNRVMIGEMALPATLVAILISLPYLFSPLQVWIGSYSDRHPLWGYRRTPYIALGLLLCIGGAALAPTAAFLMAGIGVDGSQAAGHGGTATQGVLLGLLAFGAWGMGFNFATVSYLSLATDMAGEEQRARTVGVMWFMLIVGVIITAITIGHSLDPYTPAALFRAFYATCGVALALGFGGLIGLEQRGSAARTGARQSFATLLRLIGGNPQARLFFVYLVVLLIALLGQDLLLEPFAGQVFGAPVDETTRYTGYWGAMLLIGLLVASPLTRRVGKRRAAALGGLVAGAGLLMIALSGIAGQKGLFIPALVTFGFGSGVSTAANLALMLDMTLAGQVGAFIGAWGMADALARLCGNLLAGTVRDGIQSLTSSVTAGYVTVFLLEALALGISLLLLRHIDVARFQAGGTAPVDELLAVAEQLSS
ncbi:MAG TPA: BCD family MFS transporter [Roseiflexaceae bacterium]|nr:BCD family MFS transporter [Roseiflexaceae bacterium]